MWKKALIALASVALFTLGLGVVVYIGLARERIAPTPTPRPQPTALPSATLIVESSHTPTPRPKVKGQVRAYEPGALIIVVTPLDGNIEQIVISESVRLAFADGLRAAPMDIRPGCILSAEGSIDAQGRLEAQSVVILDCQGAKTSTPTRQPTPTVTATRILTVPTRAWLGEYFQGVALQGAPTLTRIDPQLDFQWGDQPPAPSLPADNWSARWRGRWPLEEGGYRFYAYADDGVRFWLDGQLLIDHWQGQSGALGYADLYVQAGVHDLRVEYYEAQGSASVRVWWEYLGMFPDWKGEYFANPDLQGAPAWMLNQAAIDFNWGGAAPHPSLPADGFSARWTRTLAFEEGAYRFAVLTEGGVRLWVDSVLLIDAWRDVGLQALIGHIALDRGLHQVHLEYLETQGNARVQLSWDQLVSFAGWKGEYYANPDLTGRVAFVRDDHAIRFDWHEGSPGSGLPADHFSVRWTRQMQLREGFYRIQVIAEGGVRVVVDNRLVLDAWRAQGFHQHEVDLALGGQHLFIVEYAERGGRARITVELGLAPTPTPSPTATLTPTWTPTRAPTATLTATPQPTATYTPQPTATVTPIPTATSTLQPTVTHTAQPTAAPPTTTPARPTLTVTASYPVPAPQTPTPMVSPSPIVVGAPSAGQNLIPTPIVR